MKLKHIQCFSDLNENLGSVRLKVVVKVSTFLNISEEYFLWKSGIHLYHRTDIGFDCSYHIAIKWNSYYTLIQRLFTCTSSKCIKFVFMLPQLMWIKNISFLWFYFEHFRMCVRTKAVLDRFQDSSKTGWPICFNKFFFWWLSPNLL